MEGLIPLVYKRIKRSVSHRHYKCLSTTGGADLYVSGLDEGERLDLGKYYWSPSLPEAHVSDDGFRRRSSSVPRIRHAGGYDSDPDPTRKRQMVRFRSHRRMFSCITG